MSEREIADQIFKTYKDDVYTLAAFNAITKSHIKEDRNIASLWAESYAEAWEEILSVVLEQALGVEPNVAPLDK